MKNNRCLWVKTPNKEGVPGVYCGKTVRYSMRPDGGEKGAPVKRVYEPFCPVHMALFAAMLQADE